MRIKKRLKIFYAWKLIINFSLTVVSVIINDFDIILKDFIAIW